MQRLIIFIAAFSMVLLYFLSIIFSGLYEPAAAGAADSAAVTRLKRDFALAHPPLREEQESEAILKILPLPRFKDYYLVHFGYSNVEHNRNAIEVWRVEPQAASVCVFNDGGLQNGYVDNIRFFEESDKILLCYTIFNRAMKHREVEVAVNDIGGTLKFDFVKGGEKAQ